MEVLREFVENGGDPQLSDAYTINGQPGDLYPCSKPGQISESNFASSRTVLLASTRPPHI